jgi:hypothetical protein
MEWARKAVATVRSALRSAADQTAMIQETAAAPGDETDAGGGDCTAAGGAGTTGGISEEKVSGTVTDGTSSGMLIGATGVVGRDGDDDGRDGAGQEEAGGQVSSTKSFLQLARHDFSGFAVDTISEVDAWLYHAARSPATS